MVFRKMNGLLEDKVGGVVVCDSLPACGIDF